MLESKNGPNGIVPVAPMVCNIPESTPIVLPSGITKPSDESMAMGTLKMPDESAITVTPSGCTTPRLESVAIATPSHQKVAPSKKTIAVPPGYTD